MLKEILFTGLGGALLLKERVEEELKTLEEKKQKYNAIYEELARKKKQKAS